MGRGGRAWFGISLLLVAATAGAVEYHDFFVGFGTEVMVVSDAALRPVAEQDATVFETLAVRAVSFAATYGPASVRPIRLRAGVGWFPHRPFRVAAGLEIPLYERLNRANARGFGVYVLGDVAATLPLGWEAEASLAVLVPVSALGGVRFAVGVNRSAQLVITGGTATGAYPIRSGR